MNFKILENIGSWDDNPDNWAEQRQEELMPMLDEDLTIGEFCRFKGIDTEYLLSYIRDYNKNPDVNSDTLYPTDELEKLLNMAQLSAGE